MSISASIQPDMTASPSRRAAGPRERACRALVDHLSSSSSPTIEEMIGAFPPRWDVYGDLVLFSEAAFSRSRHLCNHLLSPAFWEVIAKAFRVKRVALRGVVTQDDFRSSGVRLALGDSGVVQHRDNGVIYQWDITRCMFSRGNITEKMRIASWDCSSEVVVDLFAGIGYFVLPFLVKANARHVHACEWNPEALTALRNNLRLNKVPEAAVTVHAGDNRLLCPRSVAQRVNLGLLPTARASWATAALALDPVTGGWLHVHENVTSRPGDKNEQEDDTTGSSISTNSRLRRSWVDFSRELEAELASIFATQDPERCWSVRTDHIQFVKSYAPHVDHVVCDVQCRPVPKT